MEGFELIDGVRFGRLPLLLVVVLFDLLGHLGRGRGQHGHSSRLQRLRHWLVSSSRFET